MVVCPMSPHKTPKLLDSDGGLPDPMEKHQFTGAVFSPQHPRPSVKYNQLNSKFLRQNMQWIFMSWGSIDLPFFLHSVQGSHITHLCVEFVIAKVQWGINGSEGLKVNVDFLFFAVVCDDGTAVDDKAIWRDFGVELKTLLYRCDGWQDRESIRKKLQEALTYWFN